MELSLGRSRLCSGRAIPVLRPFERQNDATTQTGIVDYKRIDEENYISHLLG